MKSGLKDWTEAVLEALLVLLVLFLFCWPVKIEGDSMESSFYDGDRIAMSRIMKYIDSYNPGDVIIIHTEINGKDTNIIKRIVAEEGDSVSIHNGFVSVNGTPLDEPYATGITSGELDLIVPKDNIFVLGDNREKSVDSRYLGPLNKNTVRGRVFLKWLPLSEFKWI